MNKFQKEYSRTLDKIGGIAGTFKSEAYSSDVQVAVDEAIEALQKEAEHRSNVSTDYLKGWLAEQWHAETLKVSGAARERNDIWAKVDGKNISGEDVRYGDSSISNIAEIKYHKTAEDTAKAISRPEYLGNTKVVPSNQMDEVIKTAEELAKKSQTSRPEQAANYQDTAENSKDQLDVGNASSKPLSENLAKEMAKDFKKDGEIDPEKYGLKSENFVEWSDIARQAGEAALHAAVMSAALKAAPYIWITLKEYMNSGKIDPHKLNIRGKNILMGAGTAGLRGGIAAGLTAACKTGLMGDSLKIISPMAIGMATTISLNVIDYSMKLNRGEISKEEFVHHCMRDSFVLTSGMCGATIGQMIIPVPLLGALVGNLVGCTLGVVVFEGMNQFMVGICVESGWTFFGIVKQNYVVSEDVLRQVGYDLFSSHSFSPGSFSLDAFSTNSFRVNSLSFTPIRRGVITCNVIGYL